MNAEAFGGASAPQERNDHSYEEGVISDPEAGRPEAEIDADIITSGTPEPTIVMGEVIRPPEFNPSDTQVEVPSPALEEDKSTDDTPAEAVLESVAEPKVPEAPPSILERESKTRFEQVQEFVSGGAREMFSNLDGKAKVIAAGAYESMIRTPFARMISKAEIAWNQMWLDRRGSQAERINSKIGVVDAEIAMHGRSISALQGTIDRLRSTDPQSAIRLERDIENLKARQDSLATHRSGLELKVAGKNASIEAITNDRNLVAERMRQQYGERLRPTEVALEKLQNEKAQLDFEMEIKSAELANHERSAKQLETERDQLLRLSQELGYFERGNINQVIKRLDAQIMSTRSEIAISQNRMQIAQNRINLKIAKSEQKARPFQDRQREFERVINRSKQTVETTPNPSPSARIESTISAFDESTEMTDESVHGVGTLIESWNTYLGENHDQSTLDAMKIDAEAFLRGTRGWNADSQVEFEQFTRIIKSYYERESRKNKSVDLGVLTKAKDNFTNKSVSA